MQSKIILARHGETEANRNGIVMGRQDSPLVESGLKAAELLAHQLKPHGIKHILSSSLTRALTTANVYANIFGLEVNAKNELVELSCGQWEGRPRSSIACNPVFLRPDWYFRPPQGESYADGEERVKNLVYELSQNNNEVLSTTLILSHASLSRAILKLLLNLNISAALNIMPAHDRVYLISDGKAAVMDIYGNITEGIM